MTKPRYQEGCAAGSEVPGLVSSSVYANNRDYQWGVNFNNGNTNINHRQNNNGYVLAVCDGVPASPGEFQDARAQAAVSLRALMDARRRARRRKRPSANQLEFESRWLDRLAELQGQLLSGTWRPSPTTCFYPDHPKAREIHAPDYADRIVHHLAVSALEPLCEKGFIFDSYANRKGKGTHKAVKRVQTFARQVESGQGGGWYLQLDIKNFFNSIPRDRLLIMIERVMERGGVAEPIRQIMRALLQGTPLEAGVIHRAGPSTRARVPLHKRLENAAPGCGIPMGNLSSQFLANVFMNVFDQFVKHVLGAERYARYVDDFILIHRDRAQLEAWLPRIRDFLREELGLELKDDIKLKPLRSGIDFLGYIIFPTHILVRPRVIQHAREALQAWQKRHVRGRACRGTPAAYRRARSIVGSYEGHLRHANAWRLREALWQEFPWLPAVTASRSFHYTMEDKSVLIPILEAPDAGHLARV